MAQQLAIIIKTSTNQVYGRVQDSNPARPFPLRLYGYDPQYYYALQGDYPDASRGDTYNRATGEFTKGARVPEDINPYVQWSEELDGLAVGALKPLVDLLRNHPFNVLGYVPPADYNKHLFREESRVFDHRVDRRRHHYRVNFVRGEADYVPPTPSGVHGVPVLPSASGTAEGASADSAPADSATETADTEDAD